MEEYDPFGSLSDDLTLLPGQYFDRQEQLTGEQRLAFANLRAAFSDYHTRRYHNRTAAWIAGQGHPPMSFSLCCETLGLDPEDCRERFLRVCDTWARLPKIRSAGRRVNSFSRRIRYSNDLIIVRQKTTPA